MQTISVLGDFPPEGSASDLDNTVHGATLFDHSDDFADDFDPTVVLDSVGGAEPTVQQIWPSHVETRYGPPPGEYPPVPPRRASPRCLFTVLDGADSEGNILCLGIHAQGHMISGRRVAEQQMARLKDMVFSQQGVHLQPIRFEHERQMHEMDDLDLTELCMSKLASPMARP